MELQDVVCECDEADDKAMDVRSRDLAVESFVGDVVQAVQSLPDVVKARKECSLLGFAYRRILDVLPDAVLVLLLSEFSSFWCCC